MAAPDRYFLDSAVTGTTAALSDDQAHHLIHVMRAQVGTAVVLFDGSGIEYLAHVERIGRNEVRLSVVSQQHVDRELEFPITLAVSLPKGDRQKWLIEKAVELGVASLLPLKTARSVAQPVEHALNRLRRTVIEASKQCGRNRLMEICEPADWAEVVARTRGEPQRLLAHPAGQFGVQPSPMAPHAEPAADAPRLLAVGPEGGFTPAEVALAVDGGWQLVDLGRRILRIETAAFLMVARAIEAFRNELRRTET